MWAEPSSLLTAFPARATSPSPARPRGRHQFERRGNFVRQPQQHHFAVLFVSAPAVTRPAPVTTVSVFTAPGLANLRPRLDGVRPWNNLDAVSDAWQAYPVTDITFQHCIDANPSKNAARRTDGQQFGAHTESVSSD